MGQKYYAVAKGRKRGVFNDWATTEKLVKGYTGARYKSFKTRQEAEVFVQTAGKNSGTNQGIKKSTNVVKRTPASENTAEVIFYTDGGSRNTGNVRGGHVKATDKAAWAYLIQVKGQEIADSGHEFGATNNRMEITGFKMALEKLIQLGLNETAILGVLDSQYVLNAIQKGWLVGWQRRGYRKADGSVPVNVELWREVAKLLPKFPKLQLTWTKGHADNHGNVFVDELLNREMDQM
ncbi:viroplasmin family protein [Agrilactobacillus fermenti]|uniref:ribonuclease H family protein n=1 Tax=Agrilactobacillus fermenti TaxID=2586909 RepID=UPI001E435CF2|nr:ribonuclease H family protein [Agrilactobacillus fermenti]MCD2256135.1 viroplasmin family protein [Agrilactobacillus fermenti]